DPLKAIRCKRLGELFAAPGERPQHRSVPAASLRFEETLRNVQQRLRQKRRERKRRAGNASSAAIVFCYRSTAYGDELAAQCFEWVRAASLPCQRDAIF